MSTIFVNGFDFGTDDDAVRKHFGGVGAIKELHFQSRGAAVITYEKASSASRAVSELHESTIEGQTRYVAVKLDDPDREGKGEGKGKGKGKGGKGERPPLRSASGKGGGGAAASGRTIFVNGFDFETDDDALDQHFKSVGAIEDFHFQSKRSAVITYVKAAAAQKALTTLDGTTMKGQTRYVAVKMDDPDSGKGGGKGSGKDSGKGAGKKGASKGYGKDSGKGSSKGSGKGIYVSGFDYDTDEAAVEAHFGTVGKIFECYFQSKGAAVVTFTKAASAQRAVDELSGSIMDGQSRYVSVKLDNAAHKNTSKGKGKGKGKSWNSWW